MKNHRPITRRDFIAQGLLAGSGALLFPSLSLLAARSALGATSALAPLLSPTVPRFITVDLVGGAALAFSNFMAGGPGGQGDFASLSQSAADYIQAGLTAAEIPGNVAANTEFGIQLHPSGGFLRGMLAETDAALRDHVDGVLVCGATENDTASNASAASGYVAKFLEGAGGWFPGVGNAKTKSGSNSSVPLDSFELRLRPLLINSSSAAAELTKFGRLQSVLGDASMRSKFFAFQRRLNESQLSRFSALGLNEAIRSFLGTSLDKTEPLSDAFAGSGGQPAVSFADNSDADLVSAFGSVSASGTLPAIPQLTASELESSRAVAKMVVAGYTGVGSIQLGGFDYHNIARSTTDQKDEAAGRVVGKLLKYAHLKQVPLMLYLLTDGGMSTTGVIQDVSGGVSRYRFDNDSKAISSVVILVYDPRRARSTSGGSLLAGSFQQTRQMGWFKRAQNGALGVDIGARLMSNSPERLAQVVAANFMALSLDTPQLVHARLKQLMDLDNFDPGTFGDHYVAFRKVA